MFQVGTSIIRTGKRKVGNLAILLHLGYLDFDQASRTCPIYNQLLQLEFLGRVNDLHAWQFPA